MIEKNEIISLSLLSQVKLLISKGKLKQAEKITRKIEGIDVSKYYVAKSYTDEVKGKMKEAVNDANEAYKILMKKNEPSRMVEVETEWFVQKMRIISDQVVIERFARILYEHENYEKAEVYFDILHHLFPAEKGTFRHTSIV